MRETIQPSELEALRTLISRETNAVEIAKMQKELQDKEIEFSLQHEERLKQLESEPYIMGNK